MACEYNIPAFVFYFALVAMLLVVCIIANVDYYDDGKAISDSMYTSAGIVAPIIAGTVFLPWLLALVAPTGTYPLGKWMGVCTGEP